MIFKHTHQKSADNIRLVRSVILFEPADEVYSLITIPQHAFVTDVWLIKTVAASAATATVSVGFTGNGETADPDGFIDTVLGDADAVGVVRASDDTQPGSKGKWFKDAGGAITVTTVDDTGTAGAFYVVVSYVIIH